MTAIVCTALVCGTALIGWLAWLRQSPDKARLTTLETDIQKIKTALAVRQDAPRRVV